MPVIYKRTPNTKATVELRIGEMRHLRRAEVFGIAGAGILKHRDVMWLSIDRSDGTVDRSSSTS